MTTEYYTIVLHSDKAQIYHTKPKKRTFTFTPFKLAALLWGICLLMLLVFLILGQSTAQAVTPTPQPQFTTPAPLASHRVQAEPCIFKLSPIEDPYYYSPSTAPEDDLIIMSKTLYGEANVCPPAEQAAVIWCILNRVDDPTFPDTIPEICVYEQFRGYDPDNPVDPNLYALVLDVYTRWQREKNGDPNPGRTLPPEYLFFHGDGKHNHFRTTYERTGEYWDWSLPDPYTKGDSTNA